MKIFPLRKRPVESYHEPPRSYGAPRDNGNRQHAGCDLYAPVGTEVLAIADGTVLRGGYKFLTNDVVLAFEVLHPGVGIVRYGEVSRTASGLVAGSKVTAGQVIAFVGKMRTVSQSMLHFELYGGAASGPLTDRSRFPFERRRDLLDPTAFLDSFEVASEVTG